MKPKKLFIAALFIVVSSFALPSVLIAQAGLLDASFDFDGKTTTAIGTISDEGHSVAIQSDGKIVVAGNSSNSTDKDFAVARYNSDGNLDTTFDIDGKLTTSFGTADDYGNAIVIQSDNKIIVAGLIDDFLNPSLFAVARYNPNGSLDTTFDFDGKVTTPIGSLGGGGEAVTVQSDGKIVVAGYCFNASSISQFAAVRYNTDGSLDNTFDFDGIVMTPIGAIYAIAQSIAIQSDGKIVLSGTNAIHPGCCTLYDFAIVRYNTNGSLDLSFDGDGKVSTNFAGASYGFSSAIQSDGKILVGGYSYGPSPNSFALLRYQTNGSLDSTFDYDGIVTTTIGSSATPLDLAFTIALQPDGKIVMAGYSDNGTNKDFALARYNTNGSLDNTFDTDGIVITSFGASDNIINSLALQPDGKIVAAGQSITGGSVSEFAIARYFGDIPLTISTYNLEADFSIYPNPFKSQTTIYFAEMQKETIVKIIDILGKEVKTIHLTGTQLIIEALDIMPGIYFIQPFNEKKRLTNKKIIIQ